MVVHVELRRSPRRRTYLPARIWPAGEEPAVETLTKDIGAGGVRCLLQHALSPGFPVRLELRLPQSDAKIVAAGTVRWSRPIPDSDQYEVGFSFSTMAVGCKHLLASYLDQPSFSLDLV